MIFLAHITPNSDVDRLWKSSTKLTGQLDGIEFRLNNKSHRYEAEQLTTVQIARLKKYPSVKFEIMTGIPAVRPLS